MTTAVMLGGEEDSVKPILSVSISTESALKFFDGKFVSQKDLDHLMLGGEVFIDGMFWIKIDFKK